MHPALQRRRRHLMMTRRTTRRGSRRRGLATLMLVTLGVFGLTFVGSVVGTAGGMLAAYSYFSSDLPQPNVLDDIVPPQSTYVYDRTGAVLLARFECQNRDSVSFGELPAIIAEATVASEDRTFWENNGVDFQGIVRAALANLEAGEIVQGASTITQQVIDYARVLQEEGESTQVAEGATPAPSVAAVDPDAPAAEEETAESTDVCEPPALLRTTDVEDKIRENILAMQVTAAYPGRQGKELILETYLNLIFYGNGSYGIKAAAANYFGLTDLHQMTIAQAAFLAALPQEPSNLDPYQNRNFSPDDPEAGAADALAERDLVLGAMLEEGYISRSEYSTALATSWTEMGPNRLTSVLLEPHFSFRVRNEAARILGSLPGITNPELAVLTGGYRITTTLDYPLQQVAREVVQKWVVELADYNVNNGALVAIDSSTGEIVTYIGSVDYDNREDPRVRGQYDILALARRQPGSAFKPITYASAFRARSATVSTMFVDAITEFGLGGPAGSYRPTNADVTERGPVLAFDALRYSLNIPSVQMQYVVGAQTTATFAESLGIASAEYIMAQDPGLTLPLGTVPVNMTNMAQAYGVFAQRGELHPATTIIEIRDRDGRIIYTREDNGPPVTNPMTAAEAYLPHWILEGNTDPARNLLWGDRANLFTVDGERRQAGFKTGTTDDFKDVSGFGYVPDSLVTGIWMGNSNGDSMAQGFFSADGPLNVWREFMPIALNQPWDWNGQQPVPQTSIEQPEGIVNAAVCRWSGMAATNACGRTITLPFLEGTVPPFDNVHQGCLNLEAYVSQAVPNRPDNWVIAADRWSDRVVNGQTGGSADPNDSDNPNLRNTIVPLHGESLPNVCGELVAPTPSPEPTPDPNATPAPPGGGGGPPCGTPNAPVCPPPPP